MAVLTNKAVAVGSSMTSNVAGNKGNKIDFSCTWNENK